MNEAAQLHGSFQNQLLQYGPQLVGLLSYGPGKKRPQFLNAAITQRVQIPHYQGLRAQRPHLLWLLGPDSLTMRYLDSLGNIPGRLAGLQQARSFAGYGSLGGDLVATGTLAGCTGMIEGL